MANSRNRKRTWTVTKDIENQRNFMEHQKGQLISLGFCPISDCQYHSNLNATQIIKRNEEEALKLQYILASSLSKDNVKTNANGINNAKSDEIKNKNSRVEGFASPTKVAKKQKILQNYSVGVDAPINVQNKFTALTGSSAMPDSDNAAVPVAPKAPQDPLYTFEVPTKLQPHYAGSNEEVPQIQIETVRGIPVDSRLHCGRAP
ncbi:hypothetical protein TNCV_4837511 [Trichonephila clavipes]|nr:hypothetical protein TNCV_4837511 [Trichonephila clavipes]